MPVLKVDGVMYCQTSAIVEYVAKLAGLSKLSDIEELKSNMIIESIKDVFEAITKTAFAAKAAGGGELH